MTNNRYRLFCTAFLFTGLLTLPFLSFSQQQEEPKRVTVVVTAKEVAPQKEIIQLPADNVPKVISSIPRATASVSKKTNTSLKSITRAQVTPKKTIAETKRAPVMPAKKEQLPVEIAKAKPEVKQQPKPKQPLEEKTASPIVKVETSDLNVIVSKEVKQIGDETATTIKLESGDKEVVKLKHNSKVNSFSYIWIGIFLIVAGLVLGLLFGKPAFLISFVGVVFITLGLII